MAWEGNTQQSPCSKQVVQAKGRLLSARSNVWQKGKIPSAGGSRSSFLFCSPPRWALFSLFVSQGWDHQSWGHHQLNGIGRSEQKNPNKPHPNSFFYGVRMNVQFRISSLIMSCLHNLHNTSVLPLTDRISVAHTLQVTVGNFCWCQALDRRVGGWEGHSSIY